MLYEDFNHAMDRILSTYVKFPVDYYEEEWVSVADYNRDTKEVFGVNRSGNTIRSDYAHLDLTPVKLGYLNYEGYTSYITRSPIRNDWRQGLRLNTVREWGGLRYLDRTLINERRHLYRLEDTVRNSYPTYTEVLEAVAKDRDNHTNSVKSKAFSRRFAVTRDFRIIYKGQRDIGLINEHNGVAILDDGYLYLQGQLNKALVRNF